MPRHFTPRKRAPGPIQYAAGWAHSCSGHFGGEKDVLPLLTFLAPFSSLVLVN